MKRLTLALGLAVLLAFCAGQLPSIPSIPILPTASITLYAQVPAVRTLTWTPGAVDATHSAATSYTVTLDGTLIGSPTTPSQGVTFATLGSHTLVVTSVNQWCTTACPTATLNVLVAPPNAAVTLVIQ